MVDKKEFSFIKIFSEKPNALGKLYEAKLRENIVICREIDFKRVKEYVIEDFIREMFIL